VDVTVRSHTFAIWPFIEWFALNCPSQTFQESLRREFPAFTITCSKSEKEFEIGEPEERTSLRMAILEVSVSFLLKDRHSPLIPDHERRLSREPSENLTYADWSF
jgi:hypothetical protein